MLRNIAAAFAILSGLGAAAGEQAAGPARSGPYADLETGPVKALSDEQIADLTGSRH